MQHSIDRILAACDEAIAEAVKKDDKRVTDGIRRMDKTREEIKAKREKARSVFAGIIDTLENGDPITENQEEFLHGLYGYSGKITINDLSAKLEDPKPIEKPGPSYIYDLKNVLTNLKRDNDGAATVSTSFLKSCGFNVNVIQWVAKI